MSLLTLTLFLPSCQTPEQQLRKIIEKQVIGTPSMQKKYFPSEERELVVH